MLMRALEIAASGAPPHDITAQWRRGLGSDTSAASTSTAPETSHVPATAAADPPAAPTLPGVAPTDKVAATVDAVSDAHDSVAPVASSAASVVTATIKTAAAPVEVVLAHSDVVDRMVRTPSLIADVAGDVSIAFAEIAKHAPFIGPVGVLLKATFELYKVCLGVRSATCSGCCCDSALPSTASFVLLRTVCSPSESKHTRRRLAAFWAGCSAWQACWRG